MADIFKSATLLLIGLSVSLSHVAGINNEPPQNSSQPAEFKYIPIYAKNIDDTIKLASLEESLVEKLAKLHSKMKLPSKSLHCYKNLTKYLKDYEQNQKFILAQVSKSGKGTIVAENPLLTMKIIRRFVTTLLQNTVESCEKSGKEVIKTIDLEFKSKDLEKPTERDLDDALVGILNIHFTYGLNATSQLSRGVFGEIKTNVILNFDDCLALSAKAMQRRWGVLAYQWLASAQLAFDSNYNGPEEIEKLKISWHELVELANTTDIDLLHMKMMGRRQEKLSGTNHTYTSISPCRGISLMPSKAQATLDCFYDVPHPSFSIYPIKTEALSNDPPIYVFHEFATDRDIAHIEEMGSTQTDKGTQDKVLINLNLRIETATELSVIPGQRGYFQRSLHTPLGNYCQIEKLRGKYEPYDSEFERRRLATFLIHLNHVPMGGNIMFPILGIFVEPIKGSAVFWFNWKPPGQPDERLYNDICSVAIGTKKVANRPLSTPRETVFQCSPNSI